jgi:hypothetical protein
MRSKHSWLITTTNQDALIAKLIPRESRLIEQWCGRSSFSPVTRVDQRMNGTGTSVLPVPDVPIISISSVKDGNTTIAASVDGGYGYVNDDARIYLVAGAKFSMGLQNITCSYRAGYEASESGIVPAGNTPHLTPDHGRQRDLRHRCRQREHGRGLHRSRHEPLQRASSHSRQATSALLPPTRT